MNNNESAAKLYNRRAKSISQNNPISPAAGPSSGQGIMFNDTSATQLKDVRETENEVVVVAAPMQKPIQENQKAESQQ